MTIIFGFIGFCAVLLVGMLMGSVAKSKTVGDKLYQLKETKQVSDETWNVLADVFANTLSQRDKWDKFGKK